MACIDEWINEIPQVLRCRECSCDTLGQHTSISSTGCGQAVSGPGKGPGHMRVLPLSPRQPCWKHRGDPRSPRRWPSADLWESWENTTLANSQNTLQDKTIGSVTLSELVCLWNDALKFQWSIHFFKCPRRYISRWIRWNKFVLPLIRRPLISSAQFYLLSSKASAFQGHLNFSRSTSTIQHHYLNTK